MGRRLPITIAAGIATVFIVISYVLYHHFGYVTAPGGDLYNHAQMMLALEHQGLPVFFSGYPKLFHTVLLLGVKVLGTDPLKVMLVYLPLVMTAAAASSFLFLSRLRGYWSGLLAFVLTLFIAHQPLQTLYDGGFPNFISVAVWLPLVLVGINDITQYQHRRRGILLTLGGVLLIILTHHFSALYLVVLLLAAALFAPHRVRWYLLGAFVLGFLVFISPAGSGARELLASIISFGGAFPWVHVVGQIDNPNAIIPFHNYPDYFTPAIFFGGLATMVGVAWAWYKRRQVPLVISLITVLGIVLLVFSQIGAFRFPLRLARDAGVPLTLLTAYGMSVVLDAVWPNRVVLGAFGALFLLFLIPPFIDRMESNLVFEPAMQYTPAQASMAALAKGKRAIFVNQLLVSIPFPNVIPVFPDQQPDVPLSKLLTSEDIVLMNVNDAHFLVYEKVLANANYSFLAEDHDPLNRVRIYILHH